MNILTFEKYIEYQMQAAAVIHGNIPEEIAKRAKAIVDKVLELNNTKVVQFESATKLFEKKEKEE